jgi:hypothetical protein
VGGADFALPIFDSCSFFFAPISEKLGGPCFASILRGMPIGEREGRRRAFFRWRSPKR